MTAIKYRRSLLAALALAVTASLPARADGVSILADDSLFKKAQADVAALQRPELDQLAELLAACNAATIGQRPQQFECEKAVNLYWMRYNRGRPLDDYISSFGALLAAFDNNPLNPGANITGAYPHASKNLVALARNVNERYRNLK